MADISITHEEVPAKIVAICTRRMAPFVRTELRQAHILGQIDLQHLANSAYLQGMLDGIEAMTRGRTEGI